MRKCVNVPKAEEVWESVLKVEKVWESVWKLEKVCQNFRKCAKTWESMIKCAKTLQSVPKAEKIWESVPKLERVWESIKINWLCWMLFCSTNAIFLTPVQKFFESFTCLLKTNFFFSDLWFFLYLLNLKQTIKWFVSFKSFNLHLKQFLLICLKFDTKVFEKLVNCI